MIASDPRYSGPLGPFANGTVDISQSHDDFRNLVRFKIRTVPYSRTAFIANEAYMTDYPEMVNVNNLVQETALHVLLDAREKINEAIADLMGRTAHD